MRIFADFGQYLLMLKQCFQRPEKFSMYWREMLRQMSQIGVGSIGIISMMSLFVGGVTALQFAYQLNGWFIPMWWMGFIVRNSMILELAPTLTALLMAGKVGSNIASELGAMRIYEQINAMEIMGVNTPGYLVGPKIFASLLVLPMLVTIAVFCGIYGGLLAGLATGLYSVTEYTRGLHDPFPNFDIQLMYIKSFVFAFIITSVASYQGFYVKGGTIELGKASTRAVVYSSILVIISNFIIASLAL